MACYVEGRPKWTEKLQGWLLLCPLCFKTVWFLAAEHPRAPANKNASVGKVKTRHECPRSN